MSNAAADEKLPLGRTQLKSLDVLLKHRRLISVERDGVEGYGMQGFIAGISDDLLALEYVYDLQIDGIIVLRCSDITAVKRTATDEFQESLMKREGILAGSQASAPLRLNSWQDLIEQLAERYPLMILERESGPSPQFAIGRPIKITQAQVEIMTFSGTGKWSEKPLRFRYSQITSLQVNNRYLNFYQKHFSRSEA
jgi:hypothetical protein